MSSYSNNPAIERAQPWLGTLVSIQVSGLEAPEAHRAIDDAFSEIALVHRLMSFHDSDSDVSRLNRGLTGEPVAVHPCTINVLQKAQMFSSCSEGCFDISIGAELVEWQLLPMPSADTQSANGSWRDIEILPDGHVVFHRPLWIDLGGIAKGYAVDRAVRVLRQRQIAAALVSAGGSTLYGLGAPPGRTGWDVTLQDPVDGRKTALTFQLKDRALSVAGSSEKSFEAGGVTYSHIMDPHTGRPVQGVLSVAVLADSGTAGDALDDALFVLGPERSRTYLSRLPGTEAFFFLPDRVRHWTMARQRGGS
jgi:thiamine biosynthesis lipoprotein